MNTFKVPFTEDVPQTAVLKQKIHKALLSFLITTDFSVEYFWNTLTSSIERRFLADGPDIMHNLKGQKRNVIKFFTEKQELSLKYCNNLNLIKPFTHLLQLKYLSKSTYDSMVTSNSNKNALHSFINQGEMKKKWRRRRTILCKSVAK